MVLRRVPLHVHVSLAGYPHISCKRGSCRDNEAILVSSGGGDPRDSMMGSVTRGALVEVGSSQTLVALMFMSAFGP